MRSIVALTFVLLLIGCTEDLPVPKPAGYFRIALPEKNYTAIDSTYPFSFEIPTYSRLVARNTDTAGNFGLDLHFPRNRATVHLTYLKVKDNLRDYVESCKQLAMEHRVRASRIGEQRITFDDRSVHGVFFDIDGNAASNAQFYVTDSTNHFLRGSLYFQVAPNIDSLAPVIDFIKTDIRHLTETITWK